MTQYAGTAKLATTIPLTDTNTPYNSSAVNAPDAANRDSIVALTNYGMHMTTLNTAKPPYPLTGVHTNTGTYRVAGAIQFTGTSGTNLPLASARLYGKSASLIAHHDGTWTPFMNAPVDARYVNTSANSTSALTFGVELPDSCILKTVRVRLIPPTHSALPTIMPRVYVWMTDNSAGTTTLLTPAVSDASATFTDYNIPHRINVTLPDVAFGAWKNSLVIQVHGESGGAGELDDLVVCVPIVEFTRQKLGEELGELLP